MPNFKIVSPEPNDITKTFETVVNATTAANAKKWLRWLYCLYNNGKPLRLQCWHTNEDAKHYADMQDL